MPLWAESRIHGDVYVRFGGRLSETYHRKVAWRRQPSLQMCRGEMLRYIIKNRIENPEDLKAFTWEGFAYDEGRSTDEHLQFTLV